ncbi:MAG: peptide chain release factor 1 [Planctomycetota bacterium]
MTEFLRPRIAAKLDAMAVHLEKLLERSADPDEIAKREQYAEMQREIGFLQRTVARYDSYKAVCGQIEDNRSLLEPGGDAELAALAEAELPELEARAKRLAEDIVDHLIASESQGDRNAIVEIRAGTGGDEAGLFARDLFEIYVRFAERMEWKLEIISEAKNDMGGYKEVVFSLTGQDVFRYMRFESGGHRVQRVPATESQGRIHTSAATVAVLPEAQEVEVEIKDSDLDIQAIRASGPGGQNVNKVSSAVRITHKPSGLAVLCQQERSQHKNKAMALKQLRSRLYDMEREKAEGDRAAQRRIQVGSGDRNMRIRTYNFPQNRLTDHRIHENFSLQTITEGRLEPVMQALIDADREQRIEDL